jgi:multiple sugar transport system ATP-binding protein
MNMIEATLERGDGGLAAVIGNQRISLGDETTGARPGLTRYDGKKVILGIRPEDLEDSALATEIPAERHLKGDVVLREALGAEVMVHFTIDARPALTEDIRELARDVGEEVEEGENTATLVGRFAPRTRVRVGETAEVAVDTRALHFFDPESGEGIYDATKGAG